VKFDRGKTFVDDVDVEIKDVEKACYNGKGLYGLREASKTIEMKETESTEEGEKPNDDGQNGETESGGDKRIEKEGQTMEGGRQHSGR
jgi:hypothetical protein